MPASLVNSFGAPPQFTTNVNNFLKPDRSPSSSSSSDASSSSSPSSSSSSSSFPQALDEAKRSQPSQSDDSTRRPTDDDARTSSKTDKKSAKPHGAKKSEKKTAKNDDAAPIRKKAVKSAKNGVEANETGSDDAADAAGTSAADADDASQAAGHAPAHEATDDADAAAAQAAAQQANGAVAKIGDAPHGRKQKQDGADGDANADEEVKGVEASASPAADHAESTLKTAAAAIDDPDEDPAEIQRSAAANTTAAIVKSGKKPAAAVQGAKPAAAKDAPKNIAGLAPQDAPDADPSVPAKPAARSRDDAVKQLDAATEAMTSFVDAADAAADDSGPAAKSIAVDDSASTFDALLATAQSAITPDHTAKATITTAAPASPPAPQAPEARFAQDNHDRIVSGVKTELLPGGGTMKIRLDPPELGPMAVSVHMKDGVMTATFETGSDEATRLLSHSLGQLKSSLEAQGVSVDKLHVQQTPRSQQSKSGSNEDGQPQRDNQSPQQQASARQDQQRKEMLQKMWRKLSGIQDPLDVTG